MDFRRILANAIARRIAYVLVAIALAWLGIGNARAQAYGDEGAAYAACMANAQMHVDALPTYRYGPHCEKGHANFYTSQFWSCSGSGHAPPCSIGVGSIFEFTTACSARPNYVGAPPISTASGTPVPGSLTCMNGCTASWYNNGDGTWTGAHSSSSAPCTPEELRDNCSELGDGWAWNAYAQTCQPPKEVCAANQSKDALTGECVDSCPVGMKLDADGACSAQEDDCPAGNVKAPSGECLPGDGQCAAGEARRPNGTCGKDSDGDGEADEDDEDPENDPDKETASGGDSCDSPPSCSGGAIACMQVKIQWRIDCNTRKSANVTGGTCGAVPVCAGKSCDALEYAQLLQQWKAACALEALASGAGGGGDGDGVVELLTGPGSINSNAGGGDSLEDGNPWAEEGEEHEPDASGYGWSRSCPSPPSLSLPGGQSVQIDLTPLCNWVSLGGTLVLILAGLMSLRIVAGGAA